MDQFHHIAVPRVVAIDRRSQHIVERFGEQTTSDYVVLAAAPDVIKTPMANMVDIGEIERHDMDIARTTDYGAKPAKRRLGNMAINDDQPVEVLAGLCAQRRKGHGLEQTKGSVVPALIADADAEP